MMIDRFVDYVSQYDAAFEKRIQGSSIEQIDSFERLVRRALPSAYREFLSRLGKNDGGLRVGSDSSTNLDEVFAYCRDVAADGDWEEAIPGECVVIAYSGIRTPELCLDFSAPGEPRVVYASGREKLGPCSDSLEGLLFQTAFAQFGRLQAHGLGYGTSSPNAALSSVEAMALRLGFACEPFADGVCYCGTLDGSLLFAKRALRETLSLCVWGRDEGVVKELGRQFQSALGLDFQWRQP